MTFCGIITFSIAVCLVHHNDDCMHHYSVLLYTCIYIHKHYCCVSLCAAVVFVNNKCIKVWMPRLRKEITTHRFTGVCGLEWSETDETFSWDCSRLKYATGLHVHIHIHQSVEVLKWFAPRYVFFFGNVQDTRVSLMLPFTNINKLHCTMANQVDVWCIHEDWNTLNNASLWLVNAQMKRRES